MIIIPAIDLLAGKCVRLHKGDYAKATSYDDDPAARARLFAKDATRLHVVDLEGSKAGRPVQTSTIQAIIQSFGDQNDTQKRLVEIGGGIRTREAFEEAIALGASYVVLGTAAAENTDLVRALAHDHLHKVIIAVDAENGIVKTDGWTRASSITAVDLTRAFAESKLGGVLYTDVARDGTGHGPNIDATLNVMRATTAEVIASGGVGTLDHILALKNAGISAVVVGRAIYENAFSLREAIDVARA